jgi:hypothetical protein
MVGEKRLDGITGRTAQADRGRDDPQLRQHTNVAAEHWGKLCQLPPPRARKQWLLAKMLK